jgi:mannose/fructose/N-acetylgalactosamine-specific phosphotransferase system component IIC
MMIAAAINLPYVGFITAGGSMPGNPMFAGPSAPLWRWSPVWTLRRRRPSASSWAAWRSSPGNANMSINALWVHAADRYLAAGNIKMVRVCNYVPSFFVSLILNGLPALLIVLVGKAFGDWLTTFPQWIMDLFAIAGGILPALGIGMLLNYLGKKKIIPFFFLGFALAKFMGLSTMMITALGAIVAFLLYNFSDKTAKKVGA